MSFLAALSGGDFFALRFFAFLLVAAEDRARYFVVAILERAEEPQIHVAST